MIYRKLSLFPFLLSSFPPFAREKYGKRARLPTDPRVMAKTGPTFTTDEYSQPLITSFSFPPASLRDLRPTFPLRVVSLPETAPPRETEEERERERGERGGLRSYFGERVRPRKPRFPSSPRCFHFNTRIRLFVDSLSFPFPLRHSSEPFLDERMKMRSTN